MEDIKIIDRFIEKTGDKTIKWRRIIKALGDPKLNVSYRCDFVPGEYVEIAPVRYSDTSAMLIKYSYRLSFFDNQNFCYKSIFPKKQDPSYESLNQLYNLIEEMAANLDEKLATFFANK